MDGAAIRIRSRPARTLLAYLALTLGTSHPRERMAGLLWPDSTEANARKNLRQALWRLRKAIGEQYLLADAESVAFNAGADFWLDVMALEHPLEQGLQAAVAAYEGELLPGFYEDWVLLERDRLAAVFERQMDKFVNELLRDQRWNEAADWAERWIAQGQIPEAAYRALMLSHAASGELSKVEAAYQRCAEALQQELGVDPSSETDDLYARLMAGQVVASHPAQELASRPSTHGSNLPAPPTAFIGRKLELKNAAELLSSNRLLTLTGPGGIGKTRLALRLADEIQDQYTDGAYFVNLAAIDRADDLTQLVADALGFPFSTDAEPLDQLVRYLRNRQLLLVMDNFEHLLTGAEVVSSMLQAAPAVKVIATSREGLELQGEAILGLSGMSFPESVQPADLKAEDAIELFRQRASRAIPDFDPNPANLEHIIRICRMVQGMPLAIELAAAWLDTLTLPEIEAELRRSLDILSSDLRDVPDRHRSIRAAFDHSWSLASTAEQEAFKLLSVFRGGFTRAAAQAVADASLELLASLVSKSFVSHDPKSGRFQIHELMRQYASEKLETDPELSRSAHEAHAAYFANFMHSRYGRLRDRRQLATIQEIDADIENIRTAWRFSLGERNVDRLWQFVHSMRYIYTIRGWSYAGLELFSELQDALTPMRESEQFGGLWAMASAYRAFFMSWLGYAEKDIFLAREAVVVLRRQDRPVALMQALGAVALCAQYLDLHAEQEQAAREALQIAADRQDKWEEAYAHFQLSAALIQQRDYLGARASASRSLQLSEELGDLFISSYALSILGAASRNLGGFDQARDLYLESLRRSEQLGWRWGTENSSKYLGLVSLALGEVDQAEIYLYQSIRIADEIGLGRDMLNILLEFARVRVAQGRQSEAIELLALVIKHPASSQARFGEGPIRNTAQTLLDELSDTVPPEVYAAASERGRSIELDEAVAQLIGQDSGKHRLELEPE